MQKRAVIAFGGNVLIGPDDQGSMEEQWANADRAAVMLLHVLERGYDLILVHGNGPQVGNTLIRVEESSIKIPSSTLDVCVADTEGSMAYLLEVALRNCLTRAGFRKEVVSLVTQVEVSEQDEAFFKPTKPIGPFYAEFRAREMREQHGWEMVEDAGRGYRRVVPSPRPIRVLQQEVAKKLLSEGYVVIVGGGGGIPVSTNEDGILMGEEAVIDKDYSASLLASAVGAELFMILTGVSKVCLDFGLEDERELTLVTVEEARGYLAAGQFPPGSMGPKIEASIDFLEAGGKEVVITSCDMVPAALVGTSGTRIRMN